MRVLHPHRACAHALDAPGGAAEQKNVSGRGLDGEVLVQRPHLAALGLGNDRVGEGVGNGAGVEDGREPRPAAGLQLVVDAVAVQVDASGPTRRHALGQHPHHVLVRLPAEVSVGPGASDEGIERPLVPGLDGTGGHQLLGEDVQRLLRNVDGVELPLLHGANQRRGLHQLVAGERDEEAFADAREVVASTAHPLEEDAHGPRARQLDDDVHASNVDAQLERGGGHHRPELAGLQLLLGGEPQLPGHASVVGRDEARAQPEAQVMGHALSKLPGVGENEGGAVLGDELHEPVVDLPPHLMGGDRAELLLRRLDGELPLAQVAHLHHRAVLCPGAGEEGGEVRQRPDGGGQANELRPGTGEGASTARGKGRSGFRACHGPGHESRPR